jgi:hypothetical protein
MLFKRVVALYDFENRQNGKDESLEGKFGFAVAGREYDDVISLRNEEFDEGN